MSKSKNNVIDPNKVSEKYTYEGLRYFLLREGVPHSDGSKYFNFCSKQKYIFSLKIGFYLSDYSSSKATRIINAELVNTLGNLLSRVCAPALNKRQIVPKCSRKELHDFKYSHKLTKKLKQLPSIYEEHFESYNFYLAIDEIVATLHLTNSLIQESEPWILVKNPAMEKKLEAVLALVFESLRINGILLQPIVPIKAQKILDKIAIDPDRRSWNDTAYLLDGEHEERPLHTSTSKLIDRIK